MSDVATRERVALALLDAATAGRELPGLLESYCEALVEAGFPLVRATAGALLLHPVLDATLVVWERGRGVSVQDTPRPERRGEEAWRQSPFYRLLVQDERVMRRRLELGEGVDELAVLAELAAAGCTDYLALRMRFGPSVMLAEGHDLYSSWATERAGGFAEDEVALLRSLEPLLAFVAASSITGSTARTLLATYLGRDAAARVLRGHVERGQAEPIEAVIWYSDLEGFTRLTDTLPRQALLGLLNAYAEALVDAIEAQGGQVLKFMGDGILATFRSDATCDASSSALAAWEAGSRAAAAVGAARAARGEAVTRPYVALHVGEVLYGNVGGRSRLDFTVLGPAVNEAARIVALCRSLDQPAILSEAFASACTKERERLVALGRFALRGVVRPQMLYTLEPVAEAAHGGAA